MKLKKSGSKLPWLVKQPQQQRQNTDTVFYNSAAWRRTSGAIRIETPLCPVCMAIDRHSPTRVTDHLIPIKYGGARFNPINLMALCSECHNNKSAREQRSPLLAYVGTFGEYVPSDDRNAIIQKILNKI